MKNSPNCQAIQKNIKKLKNLKQDFLLEMERIKKDGKTGRIFELKSEIEQTKDFLDQELKGYILSKEERRKETERKQQEEFQKESEKYLVKGKENTLDLTIASQEFKDKLIEWDGDVIDNSENVIYPNLKNIEGDLNAQHAQTFSADSLETVGGYLFANNAQTFSADSLQTVGGNLYAENAQTFSADSLQTVGGNLYANNTQTFFAKNLIKVKEIILRQSRFQSYFDESGGFNWQQAEVDGKLILPEETRKKVEWAQ